MVFGIVGVMEVDVITEKSAAHSMMANLIPGFAVTRQTC
jgi:hypothetical protein